MSKRKRQEGEVEAREFENNFRRFSDEDPGVWEQMREEFPGRIRAAIPSLLHRLQDGLKHEDDHDGSIYTGTSGIALLHLRLHDALPQGRDLETAEAHLKVALGRVRGRRFTFLCGDAGPLAVGAVVFAKQRCAAESNDCIERLYSLYKQVLDPGLPDELLYGRTGYLYALLYVRARLPRAPFDQAAVERVFRAVLQSGEALAKRGRCSSPLMYAWHEKNYIGAAHGLSGIFCLLMQISDPWAQSAMTSLVKPSVDYVLQLAFPSGNFPSSLGNSSDRLVHWCHGAPGDIHMLLQAHKVFGDAKYLAAARRCGEVIWERGLLRKGYGLCHGSAGNGYGLLALYQATKEDKYLYQAYKFAEWCLDYGKHGCRTPDRPYSLFEGMAGTIYFLADLRTPETASFPALFF